MSDADRTGLLPTHELEPSTTARYAVVWLHGLGADGYDFAPLPPQLGLPAELAVRYVFPHAPAIPVTLNQGFVMPAWYDIQRLGERAGDEPGVRRSAARIEALIAREVERGVPHHRIVLAGFSQGGAMTLFTGLRQPQRLAGLMALSSYLLFAEATAEEASAANRDVPIFQAHGTQDPMIDLTFARQTRAWLETHDYPVEYHEYPMAHQVNGEEIRDIGRWLTRVLQAAD